MAFSITGESLTKTVVQALRERLRSQQVSSKNRKVGTELAKMAIRFSKLPVRDSRSADQLLGYNESGLPN